MDWHVPCRCDAKEKKSSRMRRRSRLVGRWCCPRSLGPRLGLAHIIEFLIARDLIYLCWLDLEYTATGVGSSLSLATSRGARYKSLAEPSPMQRGPSSLICFMFLVRWCFQLALPISCSTGGSRVHPSPLSKPSAAATCNEVCKHLHTPQCDSIPSAMTMYAHVLQPCGHYCIMATWFQDGQGIPMAEQCEAAKATIIDLHMNIVYFCVF